MNPEERWGHNVHEKAQLLKEEILKYARTKGKAVTVDEAYNLAYRTVARMDLSRENLHLFRAETYAECAVDYLLDVVREIKEGEQEREEERREVMDKVWEGLDELLALRHVSEKALTSALADYPEEDLRRDMSVATMNAIARKLGAELEIRFVVCPDDPWQDEDELEGTAEGGESGGDTSASSGGDTSASSGGDGDNTPRWWTSNSSSRRFTWKEEMLRDQFLEQVRKCLEIAGIPLDHPEIAEELEKIKNGESVVPGLNLADNPCCTAVDLVDQVIGNLADEWVEKRGGEETETAASGAASAAAEAEAEPNETAG